MLQNISISNKCCFYDIFYSWKKYKKNVSLFWKKKSTLLLYYNITTNKNVSANWHIRMILEVSCDTEEDREEWL